MSDSIKRIYTGQGHIIKFPPAPYTDSRRHAPPPAFAKDHPGVEWMRYAATYVFMDPLGHAEAVPKSAWQAPRPNSSGSVSDRTFVSCGRKLKSRAEVAMIFQREMAEEVE